MSKFYTYVGQNREKGGQVLHVGYKDGVRFEEAVKFKPMLGKLTNPKPDKEYEYHDIYGNPLQWKRFDSIDKYRHFMDEYDEMDFYGTIREDYQYLSEQYPGEIDYDLSTIRPFWIDIETGRNAGDEWCETHEAAITSISIKCRRTGKYWVMATKKWDPKKSVLSHVDLKKVTFKHCADEMGIFKYLRKILRCEKPDMLIGFHSDGFDFPYIIKRGEYVMGKKFMKSFSPWARVTSRKKVDRDTGKIIDYFNEIQGTPLMDYLKMYKKFIYKPREQYSLDFLAEAELGENKLNFSDKYDTLFEMWEKDPQLYIDYNIQDVELMDLMDDKLGLVDLSCTIAYFAKVNFVDTLGTVGIWDSIFYNTLKKKNVMIPPKHTGQKEKYVGGAVIEPKPGIYEWLIAVDLKSLYPHVQQQYNISPESIIEGDCIPDIDIEEDLDDRFLKGHISGHLDYILAANGAYFRKDKEGIIPGLLREIYDDRSTAKKGMLARKKKLQTWKEQNGIGVKDEFDEFKGNQEVKDEWAEQNKTISTLNNYQMAMKILMNSEYGALANIHFRYYDIRLASAITLCAQLALKWAAKRVMEDPAAKKYKYELVYGDTDSLYISVKNVVDQIRLRNPDISDGDMTIQINKFVAKIIQPVLKKGYEDLAIMMNANENRMFMNHEKTITNALFTSKKHYALNVLWDEGTYYPEPKLSVKGIEIVRSSTPKIVRDALKKAVGILLKDESELLDFVKEYKAKYKKYSITEIAFPRSANKVDKYLKENKDGSFGYEKKTPIAVRAAIVYNNAIRNDKNFPAIVSGTKIKYVYLTMPNHLDENVIGFLRRCPEEVIKYIDWDTQFEKSFMSVITNIYRKLGMEFKMHKEVNLNDIF